MEILGILGFALTAIATYYAWSSHEKTFDITDDRNNLLGVFKSTQKLHIEFQGIIQKYIDEKQLTSKT
ncbi:hypothetical protein B0A80_13420 [Flavobacterium tructae]|uniref:hypothetical protein n=1 Tax=Flavobacterium tructae TaxID=1114873 RepID=UPI000B5BC505|nr:hypothetical protein [Flavobacterium tructae]OXB22985.1 hypothetical protein B0A80_13420 [Flavobacterium tructae]